MFPSPPPLPTHTHTHTHTHAHTHNAHPHINNPHVRTQWSFGVVLWEVMTLGQMPYEEVPAEEMLSVLTSGQRLTQPKNCPDDLYVNPISTAYVH